MSHITSARVQFGPWPKYAGMKGWIRSSAPVYDKVTGAAIFINPLPFVLGPDGVAILKLPFTDREVNTPSNFTYEVRWVSGYQTAPPARKFKLPSDQHEVNYMTMVQTSTAGLWAPSETPALPEAEEPYHSTPASESQASVSSYVHTQTTAAASWVIEHPLNKKPAVALVVGGRLVYSDIEYASNSRVTVVWPVPTVGEAHLV